jgi:hydrogenase maturation factor
MNMEGLCAFSMDPVIGTEDGIGIRAIQISVNNLAATGVDPVAVMISVLLPEEWKEKQLKQLMKEIKQACDLIGVAILGGHTETTKAVKEPVITVTAIGQAGGHLSMTGNAKPDQDIVMTKYAAMEGTALIAKKKEDELKERYSSDFIQSAKKLIDDISIVKEAKIARTFGASAMHDVRKGGIYGALWELTSAAEIGMEVCLEEVPVRQETVEVCEFYDLNPYKLISGGSLLIVTKNGHELVRKLKGVGIPAAVIGKTTKEQSKKIVREGEAGFLEPPKSDEIYQCI